MAKSKTKWKIEVIVIELVLIVALLGVIFLKKVDSYHFDYDATYFCDSVDFLIPEGSIAKVDNKTKTISIERKNDENLVATGIPVYFNNSNKVVIMQDLGLLKISNGNVDSYKLSYFTELEIDSNYGITISRDNNTKYEMGGILFDGENTYFFLEDVLIEVNDKRFKLPAYSYINVVKDNYFEYYNYNTKESSIEQIDDSVYARHINDSFCINLSTDIVSFKSNDVMLNGYIKSYKPYFEVDVE